MLDSFYVVRPLRGESKFRSSSVLSLFQFFVLPLTFRCVDLDFFGSVIDKSHSRDKFSVCTARKQFVSQALVSNNISHERIRKTGTSRGPYNLQKQPLAGTLRLPATIKQGPNS